MRHEGVDLAGYTWTQVASDVQDLRQALRTPTINLVGFSSGTHAILATLRTHPAGIGRVVLIGTEGPDDTRKLPANIDRQLDRINRLVSEDVELRREVPDFLGLMRRVLDRSERRPFEVVVKLSNETARMQVGKFALQYITARSLSGPDEFGRLTLLYLSLSRGDTGMLTQMVQRIVSRRQSNPLASVMDGASGVSSERWARIEREAADSPLGNAVNFPFPEIGKTWRYADLGPSYRAPITSDIPALFVTGELDGNTPPAQADEVRNGFPNGVHLVIANGGHGSPITTSDAAAAVVAFLQGNDVGNVRIVAPVPRFLRSAP
jgi:pimeloyl-ACP methyl ester carboxylesterase